MYLSRWGVNSNSNLGPSGTIWKLGCLRKKQLGDKLLHVLLKNGFRGFRGFRNPSIKFPKTLGKHISLNIGEREEKKDENQIRNTSIRQAPTVKYEKGGELSHWGALRNLPQEASRRQAPLFFPINRGGGCFKKYSSPLSYAFRLFCEKIVSVKKIQAGVFP